MNNNLPRIEYGTDGQPYILTISGDQITPDMLRGWLYEDRPRGEWIVKGQDIYCSICGQESGYNEFGASRFSNYCPNCGAKMWKGDPDCLDEDAKNASIPYTYNAPQHDWKCGYPDIIGGKEYYKRRKK